MRCLLFDVYSVLLFSTSYQLICMLYLATCLIPSFLFLSQHVHIGRVLIAWFNDHVLGKSGQIANPIFAKVDPVQYCRIYANVYVLNLLMRMWENSQIDTHN